MLISRFLISIALIALQQLPSMNVPAPARGRDLGDTGIDSTRTPKFTGDIQMRPIAGDYDTAPVWIRRPSPAYIGAVFPTKAVREGIDGLAEINCRLTVEGVLSGCKVTKDIPAGVGFGSAARALALDLNVAPAKKGGQPVASDVSFVVTFAGPGDSTVGTRTGFDTTNTQAVLLAVPWVRAPTYAEVVAAYPAAARAANKGGRVSMACTFNPDGTFLACDVNNEEPVGLGFGDAALSLARYFRGPVTTDQGVSLGGKAVRVPVTFSERMLLPGGRPVTGRPAMAVLPSNVDFGRAFPVKARRASVLTSDVVLDCAIADGGLLDGCAVAKESPQGYDFGQAALSLAPKFQVNPWTLEGLPTAGGRVRVPVKYQLKAG